MVLFTTLEPFNKLEIDFMGPIHPLTCRIGALYIIATTEYLTKWVEATPVKDWTKKWMAS
jgi:hypothetical protein